MFHLYSIVGTRSSKIDGYTYLVSNLGSILGGILRSRLGLQADVSVRFQSCSATGLYAASEEQQCTVNSHDMRIACEHAPRHWHARTPFVGSKHHSPYKCCLAKSKYFCKHTKSGRKGWARKQNQMGTLIYLYNIVSTRSSKIDGYSYLVSNLGSILCGILGGRLDLQADNSVSLQPFSASGLYAASEEWQCRVKSHDMRIACEHALRHWHASTQFVGTKHHFYIQMLPCCNQISLQANKIWAQGVGPEAELTVACK